MKPQTRVLGMLACFLFMWAAVMAPAQEQLDKYEVTNARYCAFLNDQGNQIEGGVPWLDLKI